MENDPFDLGADAPPPAPQPQGGSISERASAAGQARRLEPLLDGLNDEQSAAVTANDGPLLLLAGEGSRLMTGTVLTVDGGHVLSIP